MIARDEMLHMGEILAEMDESTADSSRGGAAGLDHSQMMKLGDLTCRN